MVIPLLYRVVLSQKETGEAMDFHYAGGTSKPDAGDIGRVLGATLSGQFLPL